MAAAATQVLQTNELLEIVLAALPARDILVFHAVNKTWQAIIIQSRNIQRKLFYVPSHAALRAQPTPYEHNGHSHTPPVYDRELSFDRILTTRQSSVFDEIGPRSMVASNFLISRIRGGLIEQHAGKSESWSDMFLTQPPCTTVLICVTPYRQRVRDEEALVFCCAVRDPVGVKFGPLGQVVCDMVWPDGEREDVHVVKVSVVFGMYLSKETYDVWAAQRAERKRVVAKRAEKKGSAARGISVEGGDDRTNSSAPDIDEVI